MSIHLYPMTESEFQFWITRSIINYARDKKVSNNYTEAEAQEIAERDFKTLLPNGIQSANNYLFSIKLEADHPIGYLWFGATGAIDNRKAFIYDIIIEEPHRGKGYGRQAMLAAEVEAKKLGLKEIGLHVFGYNTVAIELYKSLGYKTTDLVMAKSL